MKPHDALGRSDGRMIDAGHLRPTIRASVAGGGEIRFRRRRHAREKTLHGLLIERYGAAGGIFPIKLGHHASPRNLHVTGAVERGELIGLPANDWKTAN